MSNFVQIALPDWLPGEVAAAPALENDEAKMKFVLRLAQRNIDSDGGPFAAMIVDGAGGIVAAGVNRVVPSSIPIAHAEIVAIAAAGQALGTWDLASRGTFTLVTTTEPCAMCLGAIPWAGVKRLVIGARDADARAAGFDEGNKPADWTEHLTGIGVSVTRDVCRDEAARVLSGYAESGGQIYNGAQDA